MEGLLEPLRHDFMARALLVSALVGAVFGLLFCYVTLKGWGLMGDAVSHAVLPGVVLINKTVLAYGETSEVFTPENLSLAFGGLPPDLLTGNSSETLPDD